VVGSRPVDRGGARHLRAAARRVCYPVRVPKRSPGASCYAPRMEAGWLRASAAGTHSWTERHVPQSVAWRWTCAPMA